MDGGFGVTFGRVEGDGFDVVVAVKVLTAAIQQKGELARNKD